MDRDWRRQYGVVPEIEIEKGYIRFSLSQARPLPWDEFAPLAERSIHKVKGVEAEVAGTVRGATLTLDGSGETLAIEGEAPEGPGRVKGTIRRADGKTTIVVR